MRQHGRGRADAAADAVAVCSATTMAARRRDHANRMPRTGCERSAAKRGCFMPHITPITISMGMIHIREVAIHPENLGKSKSEMKPSEMAMMRAVASDAEDGLFEAGQGLSFHAAQDRKMMAAAMFQSRLAILSQVAASGADSVRLWRPHAHHQTRPFPAGFLGRRNGRHPLRSRAGKPASRQSDGVERGASSLGHAARPDSAAVRLRPGGAAERAAGAPGRAARWTASSRRPRV